MEKSINNLPIIFYQKPDVAECLLNKKELKLLLSETNGVIIALDNVWEIKYIYVEKDTYRIDLKKIKKE